MILSSILKYDFDLTRLPSRRYDDRQSAHSNRIDLFGSGGSTAKSIAGWLFYPVTAVVSIWLFAYISGFYPYLGVEQRTETFHTIGISKGPLSYSYGPNTMLLFKGQKAFYDYDIQSSDKRGGLYFKIRPAENVGLLGLKDDAEFVYGTAQGRIEFEVPKTGLYTYFHNTTHGSRKSSVTYHVKWGAY